MKSVIVDYRYRCHCVRIECTNGTVVRLTDYPRDLTMSNGNIYRTDGGYQFTGNKTGDDMSAGVMDLEGIIDVAGISRAAVESGVFDNARLYCFATEWNNPEDDKEPIGSAIMGKTTISDNRYRIEIMQLIDALNQSVGEIYTALCPKQFGGQEFAGCKFDLTTVTVTGTVTNVTDNRIFRDSARTELDDYFGNGTVVFTSGPNAGLKPLEIKSYAIDGTVTTFEPFYYPISVGDAYTMIPGCRKRRSEDCRSKWNNVINFGGFKDIPTSSQYQQVGTK